MAYRITRNIETVIGHEGEKGFREVRFDVSDLPEGIIYLEHLRYGDKYAYPIRLERVGNEAVWIPNETDTAKRGTGRGQLVCYVGDEIVAKTDVFKLINRYSLATTDEVPDGYDSWIQRLENLGADIESKTTDGLNAINEAKDSALDRITTVSADGIEAVNEAKTQGVNAVNSAKTDSLNAIEQKKEAVHTELDVYVAEHHDELKGEKGEKGDDYIITEADKQEIADEVEGKYTTDLALANRKIKALTDVLNGKELAFETTDYESARVDVPSGAVADSILKIGGKSVVVDGELMSSQTDAVGVRGRNLIDLANTVDPSGRVMNGITFTKTSDGGIRCVGTATNDAYFFISSVSKPLKLKNDCAITIWGSEPYSQRRINIQADCYSDGNYIGTAQQPGNPYTRTKTISGKAHIGACRIVIPSGLTVNFVYYPMLTYGSTVQEFAPYSYKEIPTNLPILRSAGSVHDSIEGGKLIRRVGEVDLGTLNWTYVAENVYFNGVLPNDANKTHTTWDNRFICSKYPYSRIVGVDGVDKTCCLSTSLFRVKDTEYTDVTSFKNAMSGVMLYYELAEPIITDIDPIPQLEAINVEAGGEISFIDHSDMNFQIPTTHEWVVRNEEV